MATTAQKSAHGELFARAIQWLGRWLLLVPEAALVVLVLLLYAATNAAQPVAIVAAGLVTIFVVRTLALYTARLALNASRYHDADVLLKLALALYPWSADGLAMRGTLALARGEAVAAEQALQQAVRMLPQPSFYTALSSALLALGRPVEAANAARRALNLNPEYAQAYLYLAEAEGASGGTNQAVEARLRAGVRIAAGPEAQAALQCALAAHLLANQRFAEASLALHSAEALLPKCPGMRQAELRYLLGELLVSQGQLERAREHFYQAETLDPHGRFAAAAWRGGHSL